MKKIQYSQYPPSQYGMKNNEILCDRPPPTSRCIMTPPPPPKDPHPHHHPLLSRWYPATSVLHEMHKMTGLRQPLHLVTKITVSHLRQLIHHCHWSVPCLCLLATAYPLARPPPCDTHSHTDAHAHTHSSPPPFKRAYLLNYKKRRNRRKGMFFFSPPPRLPLLSSTLHFYCITIKYWRHLHSYRRECDCAGDYAAFRPVRRRGVKKKEEKKSRE